MTKPEPGDRLRSIGQIMRVDSITAEVVTELRARGIRTVLLKGPSLARWLYDDKADRPYVDTDLLVAPAQAGDLAAALGDLGFEVAVPRHELDRPVPATNWIRRRGGAAVDVHVGVTGARVPFEEQWEVLSRDTEEMEVAGVTVEVLPPAARALHAVLHLAQHGPELRPRRDVEQALERVPEAVWRQAAEMAERLDAVAALAGGLRLVPAGADLADRLGLPSTPSVEAILREQQVPLALGLDWMRGLPAGERLRLVRAKLFPSRDAIGGEHGRASAGAALATYARNLLLVTRQVVPAWVALRRARRRASADRAVSRTGDRPDPDKADDVGGRPDACP